MENNPRSIIGKTITGIISRPGRDGRKEVLLMQFSDGSCFELVSPQPRRLTRSNRVPSASAEDAEIPAPAQLSLGVFDSLAA